MPKRMHIKHSLKLGMRLVKLLVILREEKFPKVDHLRELF